MESLQISDSSAQSIFDNTINYVFLPHSLMVSTEKQMGWLLERAPSALGLPDNLLDHIDVRHLLDLRPTRICASGLCDGVCP